jgi:hypothetical protein
MSNINRVAAPEPSKAIPAITLPALAQLPLALQHSLLCWRNPCALKIRQCSKVDYGRVKDIQAVENCSNLERRCCRPRFEVNFHPRFK